MSAADNQAESEPEALLSVEVCLDACDPPRLARFWGAFLGYRVEGDVHGRWVHLVPPPGLPILNLQLVPEAKAGKNRLHFDVCVTDPAPWIAKAEALGATRLALFDDPGDWFQVMADPEGNEFCVCLESA